MTLWRTALLVPVLVLPAFAALAADLTNGEQPDLSAPDLNALAAAIRIRGYSCEHPQSAAVDSSDTHPDRQGWIVRCNDARYRVVYEGDTGPQVTPED